MKLIIISDTHGRLEAASRVVREEKDADLLVHLGDYLEDGRMLAGESGLRLVQVPGNMDGWMEKAGSQQVLETPGGRILLTHGHMLGVKSGVFEGLVEAALEEDCSAVFFGHTHIPYLEKTEGIWLLNPGSISLPRGGNGPSYAVCESTEKGLSMRIVPVYPAGRPGGRGGKGGKGGRRPAPEGKLHRLLNDSDRL